MWWISDKQMCYFYLQDVLYSFSLHSTLLRIINICDVQCWLYLAATRFFSSLHGTMYSLWIQFFRQNFLNCSSSYNATTIAPPLLQRKLSICFFKLWGDHWFVFSKFVIKVIKIRIMINESYIKINSMFIGELVHKYLIILLLIDFLALFLPDNI